jgi:hypothetical protein
MANRRIKKKKMLMEQKASKIVTVNQELPVQEAPSINEPAVEAASGEEIMHERAEVNASADTAKKAEAKTAAVKKPAAKTDTKAAETKTAPKTRGLKSRFVIQHLGHEFEERDIVARIKQKWKEDGNMIKDLQELDIYIKPEECKVYYTINGNIAGNFAFATL